MKTRLAVSALPFFAALALAAPARAAESYDNCAGTIAALPAVITTQGVWCLKGDLSTTSTAGPAIAVNANNVTIDCNDFKLGGLAGGVATQAFGVYAASRTNLTVRNCNVRGFLVGIAAVGNGGGHVVEDNRLDGNTAHGIFVSGDGSTIRRNQVLDTGGATISTQISGISAIGNVDIIDNTVRVVDATPGPNADASGIRVQDASAASITANRVHDVRVGVDLYAVGIYARDAVAVIRDNDVVGPVGNGIVCYGLDSVIRGNAMHLVGVDQLGCTDGGGNSDTD